MMHGVTPVNSPKLHLYIWPERFLYIGPSARTSPHRNHAATWLAASKGTMVVRVEGGRVIEDEAVFVPPEVEFSTETATPLIAALYWEPESASYLRAAEHFDVSVAHGLPCRYKGLDKTVDLYRDEATLAEADAVLATLFGLDVIPPALPAAHDARIQSVLAFLRESPNEYDSIDALAARVHLSPSRLAHVFKEEVGVAVRRYVLWQKMRRALDLALEGQSLTAAALTAGFADSAHLSRTVRAIMGVAPEFLFRHRERLVVHKAALGA